MLTQHIRAGSLKLKLTEGATRIDELLAFASRENPQRGYLFVSKVLGKHIPVRPTTMRAIYQELAQRCAPHGSTLVVGMAETATGLGAGLADSLAHDNPAQPVYYQHTTRHALPDHPLWFTLNESHSHAVDHLFYQPNTKVFDAICACKTLILVDDEITTGRTLTQLLSQLLSRLHHVQRVMVVSLANWLSNDAEHAFTRMAPNVIFVQLIKGSFTFTAKPDFAPRLPPTADRAVCRHSSRSDLGRTGLRMPYTPTRAEQTLIQSLPSTSAQTYTVVGTGEHLYLPFLLAEMLEKTQNVLFQSTTRSPI
ncbi:MAG: phosphoribosyltransferase domain-containing protein, partial [Gammaproteobacteria bacterium]